MKALPVVMLLLATLLWAARCMAQVSGGPSTTPGTQSSAATAATAPSTSATPTWQPDNRLVFSGNGESLTGTRGGEGGSITYLGEPDASTLFGVAAEYQNLAGSSWAFGSVNAAYNQGQAGDWRWGLHADAHEGDGRTGSQHWDYSIVAGGAGFTLPVGLSLDLEERWIDVDTSYGNLPKLSLSQPWGPHWLTSFAYARSVGGNLDTAFGLGRVDFYGPGFNLLLGGSLGHVNPTVININGVLLPESRHLAEVFGGVTKPLHRVDLTLLADSIDLQGIERLTLTLNITVHL
jgi:hypothetical protein